jgi:negative regulator of flagellin synthesis FlgM
MKITHNKVGQRLDISDSNRADRAAKTDKLDLLNKELDAGSLKSSQGSEGSAKINFSERAQMMKKAKEIASNTPDVDMDKVTRLQKMIDEGKYQTDAKAIADRMIDEELNWS